ncbi:hypothetical protein [Streptomyces sp. H27-D2]|nr:hypothetical protein [Streptomyces sp. H27-D2]MEC4017908.1 hypothetical protein [Streptomyces sp. H27-D2]
MSHPHRQQPPQTGDNVPKVATFVLAAVLLATLIVGAVLLSRQ